MNRVVTEPELRTYFRCSQLHWYGDETPLPPLTNLLRAAVERLILLKLSGNPLTSQEVFSEAVTGTVLLLKKHLKNEYDLVEMQSNLVALVLEFFNIFSMKIYEPVAGPGTVRVRVGRTSIDAYYSGILRRKDSQELHLLVFSPYQNHQDRLNDPLNYLRAKAFEELVPFSSSRDACTLHLLHADGTHLQYSNLNNKDFDRIYPDQLLARIGQLERGEHFPLVPCPYNCPHKQVCSPLGIKDKDEPVPVSDSERRDHRFVRLRRSS